MLCRCASKAGLFGVVGLAAGLAFGSGALVSATEKPAQPEGEMNADAMMEAMRAANPITAQHERLSSMAGVWDGVLTVQTPGAGAFEAKGVMTMKPIMGGRFLEQTWESDMWGQPFTGRSVVGFNTISQKHQSVWFDSTANTMYFYEGEADASGVITMMGEETDPASGMTLPTRDVITHADADHMTFVRSYVTPEGDAPGFTITYSRRK